MEFLLIPLLFFAVPVVLLIVLLRTVYKKKMSAMTAQTAVTITSAQEVAEPSYDADGQYQGEERTFEVSFTYDVGSAHYAAHVSMPPGQYKSHFAGGSKVCYNPANPAQAALVPADFVPGSPAPGAFLAKIDRNVPKNAEPAATT